MSLVVIPIAGLPRALKDLLDEIVCHIGPANHAQ